MSSAFFVLWSQITSGMIKPSPEHYVHWALDAF